jgi:hypothetical protein
MQATEHTQTASVATEQQDTQVPSSGHDQSMNLSKSKWTDDITRGIFVGLTRYDAVMPKTWFTKDCVPLMHETEGILMLCPLKLDSSTVNKGSQQTTKPDELTWEGGVAAADDDGWWTAGGQSFRVKKIGLTELSAGMNGLQDDKVDLRPYLDDEMALCYDWDQFVITEIKDTPA